ncbi:hypothetical protein MRGORDO_2 [Mycobacterium phage MrGordo]|uniref:Uncharacterized protein n=1 Tax=Mycobacterium phage MrGordo TaxID=2847995 RepID=G1DTP1_9CAUD|nr:hypothetical protein FGG31_gp02 [Mycobacterium phage MrGordon]AEJ92890.1 hypothetical protein MRGORDO_2 [Mycobacterium phage MrGordon]QCG77331.1 hypothetical protein SEA_SUMTER_2 [Mycobacterium phage Sumter]
MEDEDLDADRNDCAHGVEGPCPVCLPELFEDGPYQFFPQRYITGVEDPLLIEEGQASS